MSLTALPVADSQGVRRYARDIARRHPRLLGTAIALHVGAALAALAAPRLLGDLVQAVQEGTTLAHVDRIMIVLAGFLLLATVLTRYARYVSQVLGEQVLAELREDFVGQRPRAARRRRRVRRRRATCSPGPRATSTSSAGRSATRCPSGRSP